MKWLNSSVSFIMSSLIWATWWAVIVGLLKFTGFDWELYINRTTNCEASAFLSMLIIGVISEILWLWRTGENLIEWRK